MSISVAISIVAVVLSASSFAVNLLVGHRASVRSRKPILVFIDDPSAHCWCLRNIGNGPAVNVIVGQRQPRREGDPGHWFNPVRMHPLSRDEVVRLGWLGRTNDTGLGCTYFDSEGRAYTSTLGSEVLRIYDGRRLPDWAALESQGRLVMPRHWNVRPYDRHAPRWGDVSSGFRT